MHQVLSLGTAILLGVLAAGCVSPVAYRDCQQRWNEKFETSERSDRVTQQMADEGRRLMKEEFMDACLGRL